MQAQQVPDAAAEEGAKRQEEAGPDGGRDGDARHKDRVANPEDAGCDRERNPKSGNVPSEDQGPHAPATEPALGLVDARGGEMQHPGEAVLDDRPTPAP